MARSIATRHTPLVERLVCAEIQALLDLMLGPPSNFECTRVATQVQDGVTRGKVIAHWPGIMVEMFIDTECFKEPRSMFVATIISVAGAIYSKKEESVNRWFQNFEAIAAQPIKAHQDDVIARVMPNGIAFQLDATAITTIREYRQKEYDQNGGFTGRPGDILTHFMD